MVIYCQHILPILLCPCDSHRKASMMFNAVLFVWLLHLIVVALGLQSTDYDVHEQGLYLAGHTLVARKIGNPTRFRRRDHSSEQLSQYRRQHQSPALATQSWGSPVGDLLNSMTVGPRGPMLLQDTTYLDVISKFNRERIPERVVHAKGAGAFGEFVVTHDVTRYTKARVFSKIGKTTRIAVRFSSVAGEMGSSDTVRDPRGFAVKFYTEDGNWDLTGNNTPIFFVRDSLLFPQFIHSQKRNPVTHLKDPDAYWDFITLEPETTHQVMILFSDRGIPNGHRHMHGYGSHTFKLVNAAGNAVYCKFHYKSNQGREGIDTDEAERLAGSQPDYAIKDLYDAIADGNYPTWTFYIQVMTFEEAERYRWNPFDVTKVWPQADHPLIPVGRFTLNENPKNYFAQVEQLAFDPASMPPGIEPSPDKMLHGRLFAYGDAHRYRLGTNFQQIPVNCPMNPIHNYQRDGLMTVTDNQGGAPNYYPNSFGGPVDDSAFIKSHSWVTGDVARYNSTDEDNFSQPTIFWTKVLKQDERLRLVSNIARHLVNAQDSIQERAVRMFTNVHADFGRVLREALVNVRRSGQ